MAHSVARVGCVESYILWSERIAFYFMTYVIEKRKKKLLSRDLQKKRLLLISADILSYIKY